MRSVGLVVFPENYVYFTLLFFFFTQLGILSRVFLYAGANPAYSNNTEQKTECIMLFLKIKEIVHISKSSMRYLVFRKISITMINEHQFIGWIFSETSNKKQDQIIFIISIINYI